MTRTTCRGGQPWQSLRNDAALFLCHDGRCRYLGQSASSLPGRGRRWSCLPAKFGPSRVVSPSGFFVAGSLLSVVRPLLTPAPARRPSLTTAPAVSSGLGLQAFLSKDVNSCCTTGPLISGTEH